MLLETGAVISPHPNPLPVGEGAFYCGANLTPLSLRERVGVRGSEVSP